MMNDPFNCELVVEIAGICKTILYEKVVYTDRKATVLTKSTSLNFDQLPTATVIKPVSSKIASIGIQPVPTKLNKVSLIIFF
jgi:hypothetical protein